jgi:hypothetical protein
MASRSVGLIAACGVHACAGTLQAKPYRRVDYSHSSVQLMKIAHDNQLLVNHLTTISKAVSARNLVSWPHTCILHGLGHWSVAVAQIIMLIVCCIQHRVWD